VRARDRGRVGEALCQDVRCSLEGAPSGGTGQHTAPREGDRHAGFVRVTMPIHAFFGRRLRVIREVRGRRVGHVVDVEHPLAPKVGLRLPVEWTDLTTPITAPSVPEPRPRFSPEVVVAVARQVEALIGQGLVGVRGSCTTACSNGQGDDHGRTPDRDGRQPGGTRFGRRGPGPRAPARPRAERVGDAGTQGAAGQARKRQGGTP
jgi:hypothetical protein